MAGLLERYEAARAAAADGIPGPTAPVDDRSNISRGFSAGIDQTQALAFGALSAAGDLLDRGGMSGGAALAEYGIEGYQRNMDEAAESAPDVAQFSDIRSGSDAAAWAMYEIGRAVPTLATVIGTGGAVGAAGQVAARKAASAALKSQIERRAAGLVATGLSEKAALKGATEAVTRSAVKAGGIAGFTAPNVGLATGGIMGQVEQETSQLEGPTALAFGTVSGMLDTVPLLNIARRAGISSDAVKQGVWSKISKDALKGIRDEGATEFVQTLVEAAAVDYVQDNLGAFTLEDLKEAANAAAAGGLIGGLLGGAGGAASSFRGGVDPSADAAGEIAAIEAELDDVKDVERAESLKTRAEETTSALAERLEAEARERIANGDQGAYVQAQSEIAKLYERLGSIRTRTKGVAEEATIAESTVDTSNPDIDVGEPARQVEGDLVEPGTDAVPQRTRVPIGKGITIDGESVVVAGDGKPWKNERAATRQLKGPIAKTHEVKPDANGFLLAPKPTAELTLDAKANEAATSPTNDLPEPTEAQKQAGNYRVGKVKLDGLNISIENPKGSQRKGVDPSGKPWSVKMKSHYGYVKGSEAVDGDAVDVFLSDDAENTSLPVYIIDQVDESGAYDEPKVMIGYGSQAKAEAAYLSNYAKGWTGLGGITPMAMADFKKWVKSDAAREPVSPILKNQAAETDDARRGERAPDLRADDPRASDSSDGLSGRGVGNGNVSPAVPGARSPAPASGRDVQAAGNQQDARDSSNDAQDGRDSEARSRAGKGSVRKPGKKPKTTAKKPKTTAKQRAAKRRIVNPQVDDILTAVSKLGGIATDVETDLKGRLSHIKTPVGMPNLERPEERGGRLLDDISEQLMELGYVSSTGVGNGVDQAKVLDLLERAAVGEKIYSVNANDDILREQVYGDLLDEFPGGADEYIKADGAGTSQAEAEYPANAEPVDRTLADLMEDVEAFGVSRESVEATVEAMAMAGDDSRTIMGELFALAEEEQDGQTAEPGRTESARAPEEPLLENYTNDEIRERERTSRKAEADQREADSRAEQQGTADDFTLTGSSRSADEASARGQGDLLDEPVAPAKPEKPAASKRKRQTKETQDGLAMFAKPVDDETASRPKGVPKGAIEKIVKRISRSWPGAPRIEVVETLGDVPAEGQNLADDGAIRGVYLNESKTVYLVADAMPSAIAVEETLLHEAQHYANRAAFGREAVQKLEALGKVVRDQHGSIKAYVEARGIDYDYDWYDQQFTGAGLNRQQADAKHVDELLAHMAGESAKTGGRIRRAARSAIAAIRQWLRSKGFKLASSLPDDALVDMLNRTQKVLTGKTDAAVRPIRSRASGAEAMFSRPDDNKGSVQQDVEMEAITLYHGSHENALPEIQAEDRIGNLFDGLFFSGSKNAAASHGSGEPFAIEMPESSIASTADLASADVETVRSLLAEESGESSSSIIDDLYEAVINEGNTESLEGRIDTRSTSGELGADTSWEVQRLRGRVAKALGFKAVEMDDEHGTSYLVVEMPKQAQGDADNMPMFSRPADTAKAMGERAKGLRDIAMPKVRRAARRWFTKEGLTNDATFLRKIAKDSKMNVGEAETAALVHDLERAIAKASGVRYNAAPDSMKAEVTAYLSAREEDKEAAGSEMAPEVREVADALRANLDLLSSEMIQMQRELIELDVSRLTDDERAQMDLFHETEGEAGAMPPGIEKKLAAWATIESNIGSYLNRSYQAFDDEGWKDKVLANKDLMRRAEEYIREQNPHLTDAEVTGSVRAILQAAKKKGNFASFLSSGVKQGSKDVTILKKRKDVPPLIRELLGEYTDPRVNYTRSATKMQLLVANHAFLMNVRKDGLGTFLFETPTGEYDDMIAAKDSENYSPLNGLYTTEDFRVGMEEAMAGFEGSDLMRNIIRVNSAIKYGKVVLSPATQMRNIQSALMFLVQNGHFDFRHLRKGMAVGRADLFTKDKAWREYLNDLIGLGVLHDSPNAGELRDAIRDFTDAQRYGDGARSTGKRALDFMTRLYQLGDDVVKIAGFENEMALAREAGMSEADARAQAAYRIRNGYPTYSMVPKAIQTVRRWPLVGAFTSFAYESVRTSYNQFGFIREDLARGHRKAAARRIVGMSAATASAYALSKMSMIAMGMSDEDDEAVKSLMPPWSKNSRLLYLGYDDNGLPLYYDLSYMDPVDYWKRPLRALLNGNNEGIDKKAMDAGKEALSPFFGPDIAAGALFEILSNKKISGGEVFNESDNVGRQAMSVFNHARQAIQPGFMSNLERTAMAVTGEVSRSGKEYTLMNEGLAWLGHRISALNIPQSMIYKSYEFNDRVRDASAIVSRVAGSQQSMTDADIEAAVESMNRARKKAYREMHRLFMASQRLGLSSTQALQAMKVARISEANRDAIRRGEVPTYEVSSRFTRSAEERAVLSSADPARRSELRAEMERRRELVRGLIRQADQQ